MDVIHVRCVAAGIKDVGVFLQEMYQLLRPGGILLYLDGLLPIDEDLQEIRETDETSPVGIQTLVMTETSLTGTSDSAFHGSPRCFATSWTRER